MKRLLLASFICACALQAAPLWAQERGFTLASSVGVLDLDFSDARLPSGAPIPEFDTAPLLSLKGGYQWGMWAVELEYESTLGNSDLRVGSSRGEYSYRNTRLQGVWRSPGRWYGLAKLGLNHPDFEAEGVDLHLGRSEFFALGAGFRFTPEDSLELEYSRSGHDTGTLSLGLRRRF